MFNWFELDKRCKKRNGLLKLLESNKLSSEEKAEIRKKIKKINAKQCEEFYKAREAYDRLIIP